VDGAVRGQGRAQREGHGLAAQNGQGAGKPEAHRADVGVGLVAEAVPAGAEDLGRGQELDVHLQADHGLEPGEDVALLRRRRCHDREFYIARRLTAGPARR
jgi:hypothetical protein